MRTIPLVLVCVALVTFSSAAAHAPSREATLDQMVAAQEALAAGDNEAALQAAQAAADQAPPELRTQTQLLLGQVRERRHEPELAVAAYSEAIASAADAPPRAQANLFDRRGAARFKAADIAGSIADFDRAIELEPAREPRHWMRGISYYYAGKFEAGQRQFEGYQTVDGNDVENVTWRALCMARRLGAETAREAMLPVGPDPRVPMRQIDALFRGTGSVEDVLAAADDGGATDAQRHERRFYAHCYVGLWYEAQAQPEQALEHLSIAAERYPITHYMWDVARVHVKLRKDEQQPAGVEKSEAR